MKLYKPHRIHVVRYYKNGEPRRLTSSSMNFGAMKAYIRKLHGDEAAESAVNWGWMSPPIDPI